MQFLKLSSIIGLQVTHQVCCIIAMSNLLDTKFTSDALISLSWPLLFFDAKIFPSGSFCTIVTIDQYKKAPTQLYMCSRIIQYNGIICCKKSKTTDYSRQQWVFKPDGNSKVSIHCSLLKKNNEFN